MAAAIVQKGMVSMKLLAECAAKLAAYQQSWSDQKDDKPGFCFTIQNNDEVFSIDPGTMPCSQANTVFYWANEETFDSLNVTLKGFLPNYNFTMMKGSNGNKTWFITIAM